MKSPIPRPFDLGVSQVATDSEAMRETAEKVDLPILACFLESSLRLVTECSGVALVKL